MGILMVTILVAKWIGFDMTRSWYNRHRLEGILLVKRKMERKSKRKMKMKVERDMI